MKRPDVSKKRASEQAQSTLTTVYQNLRKGKGKEADAFYKVSNLRVQQNVLTAKDLFLRKRLGGGGGGQKVELLGNSLMKRCQEEIKEVNSPDTFKAVRAYIRRSGVEKLRMELVEMGFVGEDGRLTLHDYRETGTDDAGRPTPYNFFARLVAGLQGSDDVLKQQEHLGIFQDEFMIVKNNEVATDSVFAKDADAIKASSMSRRHEFLLARDLGWEWFNVVAFGLVENVDVALGKLQRMKTAAMLYVQNSPIPWSENVGFFFHCYPFCTQRSLHLHVIDLDMVTDRFDSHHASNLSIDDVIQVLQEDLLALPPPVTILASGTAANREKQESRRRRALYGRGYRAPSPRPLLRAMANDSWTRQFRVGQSRPIYTERYGHQVDLMMGVPEEDDDAFRVRVNSYCLPPPTCKPWNRSDIKIRAQSAQSGRGSLGSWSRPGSGLSGTRPSSVTSSPLTSARTLKARQNAMTRSTPKF